MANVFAQFDNEDAGGQQQNVFAQFDGDVPNSGVTIAPKGGVPREATPADAGGAMWERGDILPFARNTETGDLALALPRTVHNAITLPADAYAGRVDLNSDEGLKRATDFAGTVGLAPTVGSASKMAARSATTAAKNVGQAIKTQVPAKVATEIPTTSGLKEMAQQAYKRADDAGLVVAPKSFRSFGIKAMVGAKRAGIDPSLHPKATAALKRVADAADSGEPMSLQSLDTLRQVIKDAAASNDAGERRIASILSDRLDEYMASLTPKDITSGDAKVAVNAIREARSLWKRMRKSEVIDDMYERAKNAAGANYTQAGFETALRQQFRSLANNKKAMRGFSNEEKAAIQKVVRGGTLENMLRLVGKFAPHGNISILSGAGAGYALGGPVGAAVLPILGEGARRGATAMTMRNANRAADLVRSGGQ